MYTYLYINISVGKFLILWLFLDDMELGKLVKKEVNCVYGTVGSGKTCFCLTHLTDILKNNGKVVYLDTENSFSIERFKQIAGEGYNELLESLFIFKIGSFKEQQSVIKNLKEFVKLSKVSLVVVDGISYYYRRLVNKEKDLARAMLISQLRILNDLKIPVLITSEVFTDFKTNLIKAVGQDILRRFTNMIYLRKSKKEIILASRKRYRYRILENGFEVLN